MLQQSVSIRSFPVLAFKDKVAELTGSADPALIGRRQAISLCYLAATRVEWRGVKERSNLRRQRERPDTKEA